MARKLYIFGAANFAEMAHYLFSTDSDYKVAGFTVDSAYLDRGSFKGLPVIAYEELRAGSARDDADVFVAIGVDRVNTLRAQKVAQVAADGFRLASFLSRHAHVPQDLVVHANTMIMDQVNVHPQVQIGTNVVIWSNTRIAFKVRIGDHAWITSAVIGESTIIGDYSFIGINATVAPFLNVGSHNVIGAGAVILRDTRDYAVYRGPRSIASKVSSMRLSNIAGKR